MVCFADHDCWLFCLVYLTSIDAECALFVALRKEVKIQSPLTICRKNNSHCDCTIELLTEVFGNCVEADDVETVFGMRRDPDKGLALLNMGGGGTVGYRGRIWVLVEESLSVEWPAVSGGGGGNNFIPVALRFPWGRIGSVGCDGDWVCVADSVEVGMRLNNSRSW